MAVDDVVVAQRQTRTFESSLSRSLQAESEQKQQQESLASKTAEYLQLQYENQVELNAKQTALSAQLEEQQRARFEQYQLMREAAEIVGHQGRQIEDLKVEVLSPRGQSRWG
ncbi:hypothetical protein GN958_ATG22558 [Phytophthora infestans]|uniref:Uncharacterized protein n=1 Tax=Phytophthora infestans TaxID=4787 RepID=A0A8S9TN30_PHYIN|nr:hypothetical protein GN958_ATG22558 [Phytophthora infestans]